MWSCLGSKYIVINYFKIFKKTQKTNKKTKKKNNTITNDLSAFLFLLSDYLHKCSNALLKRNDMFSFFCSCLK